MLRGGYSEKFLTGVCGSASFLYDFKEFQPKYSLFKKNFPKTDANLAQITHF